MSLRREKNADLEKIFYDFMNYYKYKNLYEYDYNYHHNGGGNNHHNGGGNNHHNGGGNNHNNGGGNNHHNGGGDNHHNGGGDNHHNGGGNNHHNGSGSNNKPIPMPFYFLPPYRTDEYTDEYTQGYTADSRASKVMMPAKVCNVNETFPTVYTPNTNHTQGRVDNNTQTEAMYYKALFANLNKNLMPYVENVIKQNSYVGSPINDKYFDKETLAQLVSDVLEKAKDNPELVAYILDLDPKVKELMKNIVEALILGELFLIYRPNNKLNTDNMTSKDNMNSMNNTNTEGNMSNTTSMGTTTGRYNNMYGDPKNSKPLDENMDMYLNDCPQTYISDEIIKPKTVVNPYRSDDMQYYSN